MNAADKLLHGKTAGLPNSVWIVIVGGALAFGYYKRKKKAGSSETGADNNGGVASDGSASDLAYQVGQNPVTFLNVTPGPIIPPPEETKPEKAGITTNSQWLQAVINWASKHPVALQKGSNSKGEVVLDPKKPAIGGPLDIGAVHQALDNYLNGKPTSLWERNTVAWAITAVGEAPPQAPPTGGWVYEPAGTYGKGQTKAIGSVKPGKNWFGTLNGVNYTGSGVGAGIGKPAGIAPLDMPHGTYVVQEGDQLADIADHYGLPWQALYNANRNVIKNPAMVPHMEGTQLNIPH